MVDKVSDLDQDVARQLFDQGAMLVFLGVPEGTEFGIDYNSWTVGPKFKGVKMIPPGVHFIYYSATNRDLQGAPRTGFFHCFRSREVLIKVWDKRQEDMSMEEITEEEQVRVESNKEELDRFLGPYPYDSYKKWVSLSSSLRPPLVESLVPESGKVTSAVQLQSHPSDTQSRRLAQAARASSSSSGQPTAPPGETPMNYQTAGLEFSPQRLKQMEESLLPEMTPIPGTELRFTDVPQKAYPQGATPDEITRCNLDHSHVLETILSSRYQDNALDLLGELQCAFICFLIGQVFEGFEQWKRLVRLLCSCDAALSSHPQLFLQFITLMHFQVREIPEDFFVDIVSSEDNFLVSVLRGFFANLRAHATLDPALRDRGLKFKDNLERKFRWDLSAEPEDEAPVVVE